jgi:hypothetical protein
LQRAVFLTALSFFFFLGMMYVFYVRQGFVYFILASAFLVLYINSLVSFFSQRKNILKVYERGISFKKESVVWNEIQSVTDAGVILLDGDKTIPLPSSLQHLDNVIALIRSRSTVR